MSKAIHGGGCLCAAVRYEVSAELQQVVHCHCAMCRRHSGAAFLTYAACSVTDLRFTAELPVLYRSSEGAQRGHCKVCGSPLTFVTDSSPELVWLTLGSFDQPEHLVPREHWFVASMLPWLQMDDQLPRWQHFPT